MCLTRIYLHLSKFPNYSSKKYALWEDGSRESPDLTDFVHLLVTVINISVAGYYRPVFNQQSDMSKLEQFQAIQKYTPCMIIILGCYG